MSSEEAKKPRGGLVTKRCSGVVSIERTKEVRKRLFRGESSGSISSELSEKWGISDRQVQNYISKVLHELSETDRRYGTRARVAHRRAQFENLYERCLLDGDMRTAATVLDRLCKIDGAYAPDQVKHDVKHRIAQLSPEEREARLKYLLSQRQEYIDVHVEDSTDTADAAANLQEPSVQASPLAPLSVPVLSADGHDLVEGDELDLDQD